MLQIALEKIDEPSQRVVNILQQASYTDVVFPINKAFRNPARIVW